MPGVLLCSITPLSLGHHFYKTSQNANWALTKSLLITKQYHEARHMLMRLKNHLHSRILPIFFAWIYSICGKYKVDHYGSWIGGTTIEKNSENWKRCEMFAMPTKKRINADKILLKLICCCSNCVTPSP